MLYIFLQFFSILCLVLVFKDVEITGVAAFTDEVLLHSLSHCATWLVRVRAVAKLA